MRATVRAVAAVPALPDLITAQQVIESHLRSDTGGRCLACMELEPCLQRNLAQAAFFAEGKLPRRPLSVRPVATASVFNAWGERPSVWGSQATGGER